MRLIWSFEDDINPVVAIMELLDRTRYFGTGMTGTVEAKLNP